ncbi:MAG TPA: hypothetical protein VFK45_10780 [Gammaproteobacteria bacterium]|nr:hypothetical protein [Gammaproteobacteria bacterium]
MPTAVLLFINTRALKVLRDLERAFNQRQGWQIVAHVDGLANSPD